MPRAHSWTLLWQPKDRCSDTHIHTHAHIRECLHNLGLMFCMCVWGGVFSLGECEWGGMIAEAAIIPGGGEAKRWKFERENMDRKRMKPSSPPPPHPRRQHTVGHTAGTYVRNPPGPPQYSPCSCKTGTCVRGWSFFCALLWPAARHSVWMKNERGEEGEEGRGRGRADERVKKTKNKNRMGFNEGNGHSCRTMTQKTDGVQ